MIAGQEEEEEKGRQEGVSGSLSSPGAYLCDCEGHSTEEAATGRRGGSREETAGGAGAQDQGGGGARGGRVEGPRGREGAQEEGATGQGGGSEGVWHVHDQVGEREGEEGTGEAGGDEGCRHGGACPPGQLKWRHCSEAIGSVQETQQTCLPSCCSGQLFRCRNAYRGDCPQ